METSLAPTPATQTSPPAQAVDADDAAFLREFLSERDTPCPSCGYNLLGLPGAACPECSCALVLQVGLVEPRLGIYIAGLIGWALGAGLNGLLLIYVAVAVFALGQTGMLPEAFFAHNLIGGAIQTAGLLAWVRLGGRIRRMERGPRLGLATAGWGVSLLNVAIFAMTLR